MIRHSMCGLLLLGLACGAAHGVRADDAHPHFTVRDSIEMTRIVNPKFVPRAFGGSPAAPKWSTDRRHFFVITMKGNLERNINVYTLLLFDATAVEEALSAAQIPDAARGLPVAQFATSSTKPGIDDAHWLPGSGHLAFIGRAEDGTGQVYSYDLTTRALSKWTSSPHDVVRFDLSIARGRLVFATEELWETPEEDKTGYVVNSENAVYLQRSIRRTATHYYAKKLSESAARQLPMAPTLNVFGSRQIYLSPDGRTAVTAITLRRYPAAWIGYRFVREQVDAGTLRSTSNGNLIFSSYLGPGDSISQFHLFDLDAVTARPLLDAPTFIPGVEAVYYDGAEAKWSADGRSVVLANTLLPLNIRGSQKSVPREPEARGVEVDFKTLNAVLARQDTRAKTLRAERFSVRIAQDMNSPPEVQVVDASGRRTRMLTDLNPQFRALEMGGVRVFEWTDRHGRPMTAGLVTPSRFDETRRYPLVIQLGRFHRGDFVVDGVGMFGTTAFASRALAGRDMLVVEPASLRPLPAVPGQYERQMIVELIEDLIDALDRAGRIDPMKVGVIGFSRTGMYAQLAAAFSKRPLAAVTVADSVAATPFCYAREYGLPAPSMMQFEDNWQMGAPFWGSGVSQWIERSDLFHLDRITAAVRYETNGEKVPCYWEAFAILSRMHRPVEMIHLPLGDHLLVTPATRYTSQEGNVDWFDFWLNGREDAAESKKEQYERWRALRAARARPD